MTQTLQCLIFDWAGTTVDFGSLCPVVTFQEAFAQKGIELEGWEVHRFMGRRKPDHVRAVLGLPEVQQQWVEMYGAPPTEPAIEELYRLTEKHLLESVARFARPVPHLESVWPELRARGLRVGSTTGYTANVMEILAPAARAHGFAPDSWVASDQVPAGRPAPWMIFRNLEILGVFPPAACVKIGDTLVDLAEGRNAGCWTVSVVESSSLMALPREVWDSLPAEAQEHRRQLVRAQFAEAGSDFIIDNLSGLPEVLDRIEQRRAAGAVPQGAHA